MEEFVTYENKDQRTMGKARSQNGSRAVFDRLYTGALESRLWHCGSEFLLRTRWRMMQNGEWRGRSVPAVFKPRAPQKAMGADRPEMGLSLQPLMNLLTWPHPLPFWPPFPLPIKGDDGVYLAGLFSESAKMYVCLAPNTTSMHGVNLFWCWRRQ